jgi:Sialic acid synthase
LQVRSVDLFSLDSPDNYDLSAQITFSEVKRIDLSFEASKSIVNYAKTKGLDVIITPFDASSLKEVKRWNIDALKIASCDLTNLPLIKEIAFSGFPVIASTGMSNESEIVEARNVLEESGCNYSFLHCNSTYPSPEDDINLKYIERLYNLTSRVVGYSSHDGEPLPIYLAACMGARIIEFHITHKKTSKGLDHSSSIEVKNLKEIINNIRKIPNMIGSDLPRKISQGELVNRVSLSKSIVYSKDLKSGHKIETSDL